MKDAVATMGMILPDDVGGRDAVHVAVVSAKAAHTLSPGQNVGLMEDGASASHRAKSLIGIVDPFLPALVNADQRFWLYLYPRTITSLRHNWTHPAFPDNPADVKYSTPSQKAESEKWLRDFCAQADCPGYEEVMAMVEIATVGKGASDEQEPYYRNMIDEDSMHFGGTDAHGDIPDEFWHHAEIVVGRPIKVKPKYFSCSC